MKNIATVLLLFALAACSGSASDATGPNDPGGVSVVGIYDLVTYDGQPLPLALDASTTLTSEVITVHADHTLSEVLTERINGQTQQASGTGSWSIQGNVMTMVIGTESLPVTVTAVGRTTLTYSGSDYTATLISRG